MSRYQGWKLEEHGYSGIEIYGIGDPKLCHIIQGMHWTGFHIHSRSFSGII